jgi:hypothetical protein
MVYCEEVPNATTRRGDTLMTTVTIELPEERAHELSARAAALGITLEALIQASITDLLTRLPFPIG